jgi:hypothetical protein
MTSWGGHIGWMGDAFKILDGTVEGRPNKVNLLHAGFLLGLVFDTEDGVDMFLRNVLTLNGLHGIISRTIILFITTAVRTSHFTNYTILIRKLVEESL